MRISDWSSDVCSSDLWPDYEALAARLVGNYARMLDVPVDGEEADYLLWDVLDAANVYANPAIEPDAEHLCLAVLAIEGVASELPTAKDRKSTRLNSSHYCAYRMPSSA